MPVLIAAPTAPVRELNRESEFRTKITMKSNRIFPFSGWPAVFATAALITCNAVRADHGPGTSGGGSSTQSAETLKPGKFAFELREDFTEFEHLSMSKIEAKAASAGGIDLLDRSFLETATISYGVMDNLQVGLSIGYYQAVNARDAEFDSATGDTEISTLDPNGLTDLWLTGKYRFYRGPAGQFSVFGGAKFPTGRHHVFNSAGESVEPSATAGSGSFDGLLGLAWSRYLTPRLTLDASGSYTLRTEHRAFQLGDRIDGGVALAYRFTEDIQNYPQFSAFAEANIRHLYKSEESGVRDPNTGGTVLFFTPGVRFSPNKHLSVTLGAPIPVLQDLNGEQLKTLVKVNASITFSF